MEQHIWDLELVSWGSWLVKGGGKFLFSFPLAGAPQYSLFKLTLEGDSVHEKPA